MDTRRLWQAILGELEVSVSRATFKTWFRDTEVIALEGDRLIISVPSIFTKEWLEKKYNQQISSALERMGAKVTNIEYRIGATKPKPAEVKETVPAATGTPTQRPMSHIDTQTAPPISEPAKPRPVTSGQSRSNTNSSLNPAYTFDSFVVGSSNDLAYATCQAVTRYPGEKYNPLFIYGGVGLGKTHLMQAVGNEVIRQDPNKQVRYVTSEQFTNEFLGSLQTKKTKSFADLYRNLDILIVDDIQFLGNKEATQEEFFHTFNTLHQANKQIIMSSDKPPKSIPKLEERLRSRFEWGMAADIQQPDLETRAAIIQRKALSQGQDLSLEIVEFLARHFQHNIRELEGALTQLIAYCEVRGIEPSMTVIQGLVGSGTGGTSKRRTITPKIIIEKTSSYFDLQPADIIGTKRDKEIVVPRQITMYLMRHELNLSFPKIAAHIGGRDHTTAMHSVSKIEKLIETDDELRNEITQIKERING